MRKAERWGLSVKIAASRWWARARQVLTTDPGDEPDAGALAGARALAHEAGQLRGGIVKVGQLAGYLGGFDLDERSRAALADLWDQVPPVPAETVADVVRADLDAAPGELFARWDEAPLAAASLGQVHAAADADGRAFAVKVQYPDVAEALRDDLSARAVVRQLAGAGLGRRLGAEALDTLRQAVLAELDYAAEADALERFRAAFAGDPTIIVPAVDRARSSGRVLTMERLEGLPVRAAGSQDPGLRDPAARAILRFAWLGPLRHGLVHADPNPGNFLVIPGDPVRVGFLDYGCTLVLDEETRERERRVWRALLHHDLFEAAERFRHALLTEGVVARTRVFFSQLYRDWEKLVTDPFLAREPFAFTAHHAAALVEATRRLSEVGGLRMPAPLILLWRQRLGMTAILGMLGARIDARAVLRSIYSEIDAADGSEKVRDAYQG